MHHGLKASTNKLTNCFTPRGLVATTRYHQSRSPKTFAVLLAGLTISSVKSFCDQPVFAISAEVRVPCPARQCKLTGLQGPNALVVRWSLRGVCLAGSITVSVATGHSADWLVWNDYTSLTYRHGHRYRSGECKFVISPSVQYTCGLYRNVFFLACTRGFWEKVRRIIPYLSASVLFVFIFFPKRRPVCAPWFLFHIRHYYNIGRASV